jgi:hypothetical protein
MQNNAEGEDVAVRPDFQTVLLLRGHVAWSAADPGRVGETLEIGVAESYAKINEIARLEIRRDDEIRGLHVTVRNPRRVGVRKGGTYLGGTTVRPGPGPSFPGTLGSHVP